MSVDHIPPGSPDKLLFTPGPLTTSRTVKAAMLRDFGSRDYEFIRLVREIREKLVAIAEASPDRYAAVLMQGSGTFGLEAVVTSTIPRDGKLVVGVNGAYGRRIARMAEIAGIDVSTLDYAEDVPVKAVDFRHALRNEAEITHVCVVHCETTTGIINPVEEIGEVAAALGKVYLVDAMSSFGAVPLNVERCHIDYLVSSANKCIEGVPGFSFVIARKDHLLRTRGWARTLSLDLCSQYEALERDGQFRFTPPTSALVAFHQALLELEAEGGVAGRANRYRENFQVLVDGMRKMGFRTYLAPERMGYIISTFCYPDDPRFDFEEFYRLLNEQGFVIYPGKVGKANCFRIGNIGRLFPTEMRLLLSAIERVLEAMQIPLKY